VTDPLESLGTALEGRYTVERLLGQGGMATAYLARDSRHDRNGAIKVLRLELAASIGSFLYHVMPLPHRYLQPCPRHPEAVPWPIRSNYYVLRSKGATPSSA
jgi:serine/threonine protein kinase